MGVDDDDGDTYFFTGGVASAGARVVGKVTMGASEGGVIPATRREFQRGSTFVRRLYIARVR